MNLFAVAPASVPAATSALKRSPTEMCTSECCDVHKSTGTGQLTQTLEGPATSARVSHFLKCRNIRSHRRDQGIDAQSLTCSTIFSHCVPFPAAGAPMIITLRGPAAAACV